MHFRFQVHLNEAVLSFESSFLVFAGSSHVGIDEFVEMTKKYAQGIPPSPVMAAVADDDDDDDDVVVKNPDELPLHQKVRNLYVVNLSLF